MRTRSGAAVSLLGRGGLCHLLRSAGILRVQGGRPRRPSIPDGFDLRRPKCSPLSVCNHPILSLIDQNEGVRVRACVLCVYVCVSFREQIPAAARALAADHIERPVVYDGQVEGGVPPRPHEGRPLHNPLRATVRIRLRAISSSVHSGSELPHPTLSSFPLPSFSMSSVLPLAHPSTSALSPLVARSELLSVPHRKQRPDERRRPLPNQLRLDLRRMPATRLRLHRILGHLRDRDRQRRALLE